MWCCRRGSPDKGAVLTQLSAFWFELTGDIVPNHFIQVVDSTRVPGIDVELPREMIGRAMVVRKAERIDVECVVRGYITGSGWKDYQLSGEVSGIGLPPKLKESQELFEPIFTPTTKADEGHDLPITYEQVSEMAGERAANAVRLRSLALYRYGRDYARERGIIIADTKFEFGWLDDEVILIDEALTPDSSRFWPADQYKSGGPQPSFDKQYVRDYLEDIALEQGAARAGPAAGGRRADGGEVPRGVHAAYGARADSGMTSERMDCQRIRGTINGWLKPALVAPLIPSITSG